MNRSGSGASLTREPIVASGPPLDYSFKELRSCQEIETEDPRSGIIKRPSHNQNQKEVDITIDPDEKFDEDDPGATMLGNAPAGGRSTASNGGGNGAPVPNGISKPQGIRIRKITTAVKLNNNLLETTACLPQSLEFAMSSPLVTLQWLDLSFNMLTTIEPPLLRFENLKALYLHGNCIRCLSSVERLCKLKKLISLTLNGNPIESSRSYRSYVIGCLRGIKSLDHSTVTEDETNGSISWYKGFLLRKARHEEMKNDIPDQMD